MSWLIYSNGSKEKARADIVAAHAPGVIKAYLLEAVDAYPTDAVVSVTAYGHLHNGEPNNGNVTTAEITVQRVLPDKRAVPPVAEEKDENKANMYPTPQQATLIDHPVEAPPVDQA